MTKTSSTTIPPFHSLPFPAYYRTECQDKYSTSRLAHRVAYFDNECASSLQLTPCFDEDDAGASRSGAHKPSYSCRAFVHGHQYSRKVRCFVPWVDAAGFANVALSEISKTAGSSGPNNNHRGNENKTNDSGAPCHKHHEHASKA
mmetsp:Transcript_15528/g.35582  ORF Transcript_15528/g.35582 Transcript_15528/m.35582 type:complete len:145 (+) Transcript_15528:120-554(+)|eukprot:CAMPEP_0201119276 /NCGR_PEP_ID=MMETSP0850-20130426/3421_1 /ASSEMBLY_ACC=CAM_ASM_000622 /TAXON_ID=183588 /ORGANISM="Pseudo-nitzschia fraudulenta, Strain WWA7" /LENGTH=144 /DNA_ID=CAMNT_0047384917 /DNA_START=111 /DNA_END=545 /DNA_ORIENTATION=-